MTGARVILVSDTHLSPAAPEAAANWDSVLRHIRTAAPDVVIHLGDLTLDGAHEDGDLRYGRRQLDRLPVPWHAVPGNHDVGDNPRPGAPEDSAVDASRQQRWGEIIGPGHWSLGLDGWLLLAIDAQLAGSGLAAEESQWSWLEQQLSGRRSDEPIALVSHKPVAAEERNSPLRRLTGSCPGRAVTVSRRCSPARPRPWSSAGMRTSTGGFVRAAPTTCGRRPRGRSSRTTSSRHWARSGAESWRSSLPAAVSRSRSSSSPTASPS